MKNIFIVFACILFFSACDKNPKTEADASKPNKQSDIDQVAAVTDCDVSAYSNAMWLAPNPVAQLGAVPVKGQPALPASKIAGTSGNCDFHIFSWQWFVYLMSPSASDRESRIFEDRSLFPVVDLDTCASVNAGSLVKGNRRGLSHTILKVMTMPDIPGQAGPGDALYDKNTNIVFYNRSFTKNECGVFSNGNFPTASDVNTEFPTQVNQVLELKSSWRIMEPSDEESLYYIIQADIEGIGAKNLGLVGFHVVVNTGAHPEFVWATFEHINNAPDCTVVIPNEGFLRAQPPKGWSFATSSCNTCIADNYTNGSDLTSQCETQCDFNGNASKPVLDSSGNVMIQGAAGQTPSNICLDAYYGDQPAPQNVHNVANIQFLNTLLVGPSGIITNLPEDNPLAVFKNYYLGGAQWTDVSKITAPDQKFDTAIAGSTYLANSTLESYTQAGADFTKGCFTCHAGASENNTAAASHLLTSKSGAAPGLIDRCDVKAGPIMNDQQAQQLCPEACKNAMGWNNNWTSIAGNMSVCGCNACPDSN
ncbi:MAG: hypothetical protein ACI9Y1_002080 [Lentisphaeria bacterium]|jgi:hypothetical protein